MGKNDAEWYQQNKERLKAANLIEPSVYAIYFSTDGWLKVGFTTHKNTPVSHANQKAKKYGIHPDGRRIWLRPGDVRVEAFIQAHMSFMYDTLAHGTSHRRLSEWFKTWPSVGNIGTLTEELDYIYGRLPVVSKMGPDGWVPYVSTSIKPVPQHGEGEQT